MNCSEPTATSLQKTGKALDCLAHLFTDGAQERTTRRIGTIPAEGMPRTDFCLYKWTAAEIITIRDVTAISSDQSRKVTSESDRQSLVSIQATDVQNITGKNLEVILCGQSGNSTYQLWSHSLDESSYAQSTWSKNGPSSAAEISGWVCFEATSESREALLVRHDVWASVLVTALKAVFADVIISLNLPL